MKLQRLVLAACVAVMAVTTASAQMSGGITVIVTDADGERLPGATVTIESNKGYVKTTAEFSDKKGIVEFPVLKPGDGYSVTVSFPGYTTVRHDDLRVTSTQPLQLPVQLAEELIEKVKVVATRDVIDLDKTERSSRFTDEFIADLPIAGRSYTDVLTMAPGVQDTDGDGNPNVHGSRSRDFQVSVGGISNVDPLTGQQGAQISLNSIEEMEVITGGAGVEFGRAQGGFANVVQKQGNNTHEGVFEILWNTSKIDGTGANDNSTLPDPKYDRIRPMFQFTGPLVRDKLWYRATYERQDLENPVNILSGTATRDIVDEIIDGQLTWQISPRNKLAMNYRSNPIDFRNVNISNAVAPESSFSRFWDQDNYTLTWTAPVSPKILVESKVNWNELTQTTRPSSTGLQNECVSPLDRVFLSHAQCSDANTGRVSGSYFQTQSDRRQRFTVGVNATVYGGRFWGMSHQFKVGFKSENERFFDSIERSPVMNYREITGFEQDPNAPEGTPPDPQRFGLANVRMWIPQVEQVRATGNSWGLYVEDQFRPASNLSVTLGFRLDREEINGEGREIFDPAAELQTFTELYEAGLANGLSIGLASGSAWPVAFTRYEDLLGFEDELISIVCGEEADFALCSNNVSSSINSQNISGINRKRAADNLDISNTNFSPRLSVAWQPTAKMAIRGSAGRFYNFIPLNVPTFELYPAATDLQYRIPLDAGPEGEPGVAELDARISPAVNVFTVDRNLKTPYKDEFNLSFERELSSETLISVTLVRNFYEDQIQNENINVRTGDFGSCNKSTSTTDPSILPSPGEGQEVLDQYTGAFYTDTEPGDGDGRIDDCDGRRLLFDLEPGMVSTDPTKKDLFFVSRPDGFDDLYLQDPAWGDIFLWGNFNSIDYKGAVLELVRRQFRGWEMNASYTWSETKGDGDDFALDLQDDPSLRDNVQGFQSYDQRHVVKLAATTITPWAGIRLGTRVTWQSGLPYSQLASDFARDSTPPQTGLLADLSSRIRQQYPSGIRNDQRDASYWDFNLNASKEFRLAKRLNLQVKAEVFNLLADDTLSYGNANFGGQVINENAVTGQRRFGRAWWVGMKMAF